LYECYFISDEKSKDKHKCRECEKILTQRRGSGYANLISHVKGSHAEGWKEKVRSFVNLKNINDLMDKFVKQPSAKAKNIFGWLEWTIEDNLPLSFCNKINSKKYAKLKPISSRTLKKYMALVKDYVFKKIIRERIPKTFGLIIDGWTIGSEHYYAIFITWTDTTNDIHTVIEYLI
jgi:hypothetical protein